jgi:Uma2 family endonuclease
MTAAAAFPRRRFTVQQYERMVEAGVIRPDERVELLDGEVVEMPPIGPPHASRVDRCNAHLGRAFGAGVIIRVQSPLHLSDLSMPEPDITVLRHRDDFYAARHPTVADVLLLVEVGDTTARFDREVKLPLYASASVIEVWLLDVEASAISVFRDADPGGYQTLATAHQRDTLRPLALPGTAVAAADLLG